MQATLTSPRKPRARAMPERSGVWVDQITGRFRKITVHQLAMAWWLFSAKHITKRQLRIYFAAHEMAEKRRYAQTAERPLYRLAEIRRLIGGAATKTAQAALRTDVKALGRIGLVSINAHAIHFAVSIDQIRLDDVTGFWTLFQQLPNARRSIPVPRRTCRALAGGFQTSVMAMMIALMLRTLYWHRPGGAAGEGGYRIDGRTKCSWIAEVFGVSRRAVTDARARLIELGWITPIEAPQWQLNKWGQRYELNVEAFGPSRGPCSAERPGGGGQGESASPSPTKSVESATPCLNQSPPLTGKNPNTRKPTPRRADPAGVSIKPHSGSRKKDPKQKSKAPRLTDIATEDLSRTDRLLELHRQAVGRGLITDSEAGRLDFFALAERARAQGNDPPRLFAWLLKNRRFEFITQADEDAAAERLRTWQNGPRRWGRGVAPLAVTPKPRAIELTEDERFVVACIRVGREGRCDPFRLASAHGWTRERWSLVLDACERKDRERWSSVGE